MMARLYVLTLPLVGKGDDVIEPFALVVDASDVQADVRASFAAGLSDFAATIGARGALVSSVPLEIATNGPPAPSPILDPLPLRTLLREEMDRFRRAWRAL